MKRKAPRNRTLTCSKAEIDRLSARIFHVQHPVSAGDIEGEIIGGDVFEIAGYLPKKFVICSSWIPRTICPKTITVICSKRGNETAIKSGFNGLLKFCSPRCIPRRQFMHVRIGELLCSSRPFSNRSFTFATASLGKGERARVKGQLEKQRRGYLVLHRLGRVLLSGRCREDQTQGHRALSRERNAKGLECRRARQLSPDPPLKYLDGHNGSILVYAGKYRSPHAETRKTHRQVGTRQFPKRRFCV